MDFFTREYEIKSTLVNAHQDLRTSQLLVMMQDAATDHVTEIGMGRDKTLDRGILWVVARQFIQITRMPHYDETVQLKSWAGETMHVLFPRYYEFTDEDGGIIVRASAVWALMDMESRRFVFPEQAGIVIPGIKTGTELPYHAPILPIETAHSAELTVPFSYVDLNGHMNNARYFDVAEDILPAAKNGNKLKEIRMEYHNEIRLGETLRVDWGNQENSFYISGSCDRQIFKMLLQFQ